MFQSLTFAELLAAEAGQSFARALIEKLSFDKLMSLSDPKRIARSATVRVPPLKFDAYKDQEAYYFNVKSSPSTTGLRHKGYVKVFKPKDINTPLEKVDCEVDCQCPDYKYRWAWANKQRGSSKVGPSSLNQAWNQAPRITNPKGRPGLCKHIIATRDYIYGQVRSFGSDQEYDSTTSKLDRLVKQSQKRWSDYPAEVTKARERDAAIQQSIKRATELRAQKNPALLSKTNPSARSDTGSPAVTRAAGKVGGERSSALTPEVAKVGSAKAAQAAQKAGDNSIAAWRARRSEESLAEESWAVSMEMPNLFDQVTVLVEELEKLPSSANTVGRPGTPPKEEESEDLRLLREIRDIVRHMAGDDLPAEFDEGDDDPLSEPGIPVDAARSREEN